MKHSEVAVQATPPATTGDAPAAGFGLNLPDGT